MNQCECGSSDGSVALQTFDTNDGPIEVQVWTCAGCGETYVDDAEVAKALRKHAPAEDLAWMAALPADVQIKVHNIAALAKQVMPDQTRYAHFFLTPCVHLGDQVPGEMVNTEEGREELLGFFYLCLAMQCPECKGIGPADHTPTCSREQG